MVLFCCVLCSTTTAVLRTAVVIQDGWINRFVGKVCPRVRGLRFFFLLPLYLPRPGIVQRTTIVVIVCYIYQRHHCLEGQLTCHLGVVRTI